MRTNLKSRIERLEQRDAAHRLDILAYEFAGRTDQELEHFVAHGVWPGHRLCEPSPGQVVKQRQSLEESRSVMDGQSVENLEFFANHGYWPEGRDGESR